MHTKYFGAHAALLMFWENTLAAARKYWLQRGKYFDVLLNYFDGGQELLVRACKILWGARVIAYVMGKHFGCCKKILAPAGKIL